MSFDVYIVHNNTIDDYMNHIENLLDFHKYLKKKKINSKKKCYKIIIQREI